MGMGEIEERQNVQGEGRRFGRDPAPHPFFKILATPLLGICLKITSKKILVEITCSYKKKSVFIQ